MEDKKEKEKKDIENFENLEVINFRSGLTIKLGSSTKKIEDLFELSKKIKKEFF